MVKTLKKALAVQALKTSLGGAFRALTARNNT
jgi:hypothetical protein